MMAVVGGDVEVGALPNEQTRTFKEHQEVKLNG